MAVKASSIYFEVGGDNVLDLSDDVLTDVVLMNQKAGFSIESINATGLDGTPTYTLKAGNSDDSLDHKDFDSVFAKDLSLEDGLYSVDVVKYTYFSIDISVNDNTTGTIQFIINIG